MYGRPVLPHIVINEGCVCTVYWTILCRKPSTRNTSFHSGPAYYSTPKLLFAAVTQRVFPGSAGGLLGISLRLILFTFSACLTVTITPTLLRFLEMQKRKENYQPFTWTSSISITSWLLLNENKTNSLIWSHTHTTLFPIHFCTCALAWLGAHTQCKSIRSWFWLLPAIVSWLCRCAEPHYDMAWLWLLRDSK